MTWNDYWSILGYIFYEKNIFWYLWPVFIDDINQIM